MEASGLGLRHRNEKRFARIGRKERKSTTSSALKLSFSQLACVTVIQGSDTGCVCVRGWPVFQGAKCERSK